MAMSETMLRIKLDTINNHLALAEKAERETDRQYWIRIAEAERNELSRKAKIEEFLDQLFRKE